MSQVTIYDETAAGKRVNSLTLDILTEQMTVRELIRSRVYQEVDEYNRRVREAKAVGTPFNGLVTPTGMERALNARGVGVSGPTREVDWKKQFDTACTAFERNGFFILVDDRQA